MLLFNILLVLLCLYSTTIAKNVIVAEDYIFQLDSTENDSTLRNWDPDTGLEIDQFLKKYGYPLETHYVTTEDNYTLTLHRIPYGREEENSVANQTGEGNKPPVLLMHGILSSSIDWVVTGIGKSLALKLADLGYDVWLGNNRGNTYSRLHVTLNPDRNASFWDFSFHEMGIYDLPAKIDYILSTTNNTQLSYVGHSAGTTQYFVLTSTRPEYNDKVKVMAALSPVTYLSNTTSPIARFMAKYQTFLDLALSVLNINELFPHNWLFSLVVDVLCNDASAIQDVCADVLFLLGGFDISEMNKTSFTVLVSHIPAGSSRKELDHFLQEMNSGYFRQYDYGVQNIFKYGALSPPNYNISAITTPLGLYYADNDLVNSVNDVEKFVSELSDGVVVKKHKIEWKYFNHFDFITAIDADWLVNYYVVNLLNSYNGLPEISSTTTVTTTTTKRTTTSNPTTTVSSTITSAQTDIPTTTPSDSPIFKISHIALLICISFTLTLRLTL